MQHVQMELEAVSQSLHNDSPLQISPWKLGLVVLLFVWIEATVIGSISETAMTELIQEALVLAAAFLFGVAAWRCPSFRSLLVLFAGLFGCMFIRELDALFDKIFHGFWVYPAVLLAVGTILYATRCPKIDLRQSLDFLTASSFRSVFFGLLTVLVISRIVGAGRIWYFIMGSKSVGRLYKNVIQEGLELWGYALIATGAWCVMSQLTQSWRNHKTQPSPATKLNTPRSLA